ncbi:MAG: hypothetical protein AB7G17_04440 [Phycisphaerales bacterium]
MSRAALLITLLLALLLALTWAMTTAPAPSARHTDPGKPFTPKFDPDSIESILWERVGRPLHLRRARDGDWALHLDPNDAPWHIPHTPISDALLTTTRAIFSPAPRGHAPASSATVLRLRSAASSQSFTPLPPVGGAVHVFVDPPARWCVTPADTLAPLSPDALLALRSPAALPRCSVNVSRISITPSDADQIVLWREGTQWRLTKPTDAPADPQAVADLISLLASLRFASLQPIDTPAIDPLPMSIRISVATSHHAPDQGTPYIHEESLYVHRAADGANPLTASRAPRGPTYPLEPARLSSIPIVPAALVHPLASNVASHDVAGIVIDFIQPPLTRRLRRELNGWSITERLPDQHPTPPRMLDDEHADEILHFLLRTPASSITLAHPEPDEQPIARIAILDVDDAVIDELTYVRPHASPDITATRSDKVLRVYETVPPAVLNP